MLWMKAWLETRWRLAYLLGVVALIMLTGESGGGLGSPENARNLMFVLLSISVIAAVNLAGTGIRTQAPFSRMRGLHGSTYFTLSLPVSRYQLLMIRAGFGLLETTVINTVMIVSAWALFPLVRGDSTLFDLLKLMLAAVACTACFYFLSVMLSIFLDDTWHFFGSLLTIASMWCLGIQLALPPSANVFLFMGSASPLLTHRLPWPAMTISLLASTVLFGAALKIVQTREY